MLLFLASIEAKSTRRAYERHIRHFISLLALTRIGEAEAGHLVAYRNYILADGRGAASHSQALNAVRSFLAWGAALDGVKLRIEQIKGLLKIPKSTVLNPYQTLTKNEIARLLAVARASGLRDFAMMLVFLGAGLRVSEVVKLACKDLREDGDGGPYLHVRFGKGQKDRLVPVQEEVALGIQAYLVATKRKQGLDEPIFLATDTRAAQRARVPLDTGSCQRLVRKLCEEAGVAKKISPHSLRHTYAIASLRHSKNLMAVSKLLGHSMLTTTQRYVNHLDLMEMRDVVPGFLVGSASEPLTSHA